MYPTRPGTRPSDFVNAPSETSPAVPAPPANVPSMTHLNPNPALPQTTEKPSTARSPNLTYIMQSPCQVQPPRIMKGRAKNEGKLTRGDDNQASKRVCSNAWVCLGRRRDMGGEPPSRRRLEGRKPPSRWPVALPPRMIVDHGR